MSLPTFDLQGSLFGDLCSVAPTLFSETDRYKLFAQKIWPILTRTRPQLEVCYVATNGRPSVEPVVLLGALILQFLERAPDRQAADLVRYHLGWKLALNVELGDRGFHPTTLVTFRRRLLDHEQAKVAFEAVLAALQAEGLVPRRGTQRLDSTHVLGLVARLSKLECIRETIRLALEELAVALPEGDLPDFWSLFWERYAPAGSVRAFVHSPLQMSDFRICSCLQASEGAAWLNCSSAPWTTARKSMYLTRSCFPLRSQATACLRRSSFLRSRNSSGSNPSSSNARPTSLRAASWSVRCSEGPVNESQRPLANDGFHQFLHALPRPRSTSCDTVPPQIPLSARVSSP